ncbi:MAG: hypothetical protein KDJ35_03645 [Alphaproteobacteria bacterium]|nr:hypothetical protein [Alphaproteobacteria bacterium]
MNTKYIIIVVVVGLALFGVMSFFSTQDDEPVPQEFVVVEESVDEPAPAVQSQAALQGEKPAMPSIEVESAQELVLPKDATLNQQFEYTLNVMLRDVAVKTSEYQKTRKVMEDLVQPENFEKPDYIDENYLVFQETLPALKEKSAEILTVFEKADADINALAAKKDEKGRAVILEQWSELKQKDAAAYQRFFELEAELLEAYDRLMRFYYVKRGTYTYNSETQRIEFKNESDDALQKNLILQINRMERAQKQALGNPS